MTKVPEQEMVRVQLYNNCDGSKYVNLGTTYTNRDGTFTLKTPADREETYCLYIGDVPLKPNLKDGHNIDIGDVLEGDYTFYCKVTINPVDGSAIDFPWSGPNVTPLHFNAGTSTQFMTTQILDYQGYHSINNSIIIYYTTYSGGVAKDTAIYVPAPTPDTLSVTINY